MITYEKLGDRPSLITWDAGEHWEDALINGQIVACLETRPYYCDRGHYSIKCFLPYIDDQDQFPRYYMNKEIAKSETEAFLKWRIWKIRGNVRGSEEKEG